MDKYCLYECQFLEYMKYFVRFTISKETRTVVQVSDGALCLLLKRFIWFSIIYSFTLMQWYTKYSLVLYMIYLKKNLRYFFLIVFFRRYSGTKY